MMEGRKEGRSDRLWGLKNEETELRNKGRSTEILNWYGPKKLTLTRLKSNKLYHLD